MYYFGGGPLELTGRMWQLQQLYIFYGCKTSPKCSALMLAQSYPLLTPGQMLRKYAGAITI